MPYCFYNYFLGSFSDFKSFTCLKHILFSFLFQLLFVPGVALIQVWIGLFVPLNLLFFQKRYLHTEEVVVSDVLALTAIDMLNISVSSGFQWI